MLARLLLAYWGVLAHMLYKDYTSNPIPTSTLLPDMILWAMNASRLLRIATVKQPLPRLAQRRLYNIDNNRCTAKSQSFSGHKMPFESVLRAVFAGGNVKDTVSRVRCGT